MIKRETSDDTDRLVLLSGARQSDGRLLLDGQQDERDVVPADVAQRLQQVGHRRVLPLGPVGEQMARRSRLLLLRPLLERSDARRRVTY